MENANFISEIEQLSELGNNSVTISTQDFKRLIEIAKLKYSVEDLQKSFEAAKSGGMKKVVVPLDQYGGVNIEEHYVANLYKTFEDWFDKFYA